MIKLKEHIMIYFFSKLDFHHPPTFLNDGDEENEEEN